ncbi:MAG: winged helix-turn-helix transcriptional regulator, partial [Nanoarchaeota archaeon]|nr:winged helix-turn-helix transcriptional regulator [Nanoarchaeota archaeon]
MRYLQATPSTAKVKLDIKDRKILSMLSANARIPLTLLSRKVGLSRDAVNYRIRNYEKNGIIQGYRTMVDMSRLGYESVHMFMRLKNPSKDAEQKMLGKLIKHPAVRAIIKFSGNYDFEIAFVTKGIEDMDRTLTEIISCCSESLQDYELLTISKTFAAETFPKSFLDQKAEISIKKRTAGKADKKDLEILKIIGEDAALPLYKIAEQVGLSADAVAYRIKNMASSGVIVKFIPVINYTSIGYSLHTVLLNINGLDEEKEKSLRGFL